MGAFRISGAEVLEAPTREGPLRLEIAPRHVALAVQHLQIAISDGFVTVSERVRGKTRRDSARLSGRLLVARDVPHEDVGLWIELRPGELRRFFGVAPHDLIERDGLAALRSLDRLAARLRQVLSPYAGDARRAIELGRGKDKVLVIEAEDRLVVFARGLLRDVARCVLEVHAGGVVVIPGRQGERRFRVGERFGVTVTGDLIRFIDPAGSDLGRVALHWIEPQDRQELARRLGDMIEGGAPVEEAPAEALAVEAPKRRYIPRVLRPRLLPRRRR